MYNSGGTTGKYDWINVDYRKQHLTDEHSVLELSFCIYDFVKNDDVVTTVSIRTLRGGFIVAAVDGLDINGSPLEMK